jgi:hypothetical protein
VPNHLDLDSDNDGIPDIIAVINGGASQKIIYLEGIGYGNLQQPSIQSIILDGCVI